MLRPQHGEVGLRGAAQVAQGVEIAEGGSGHQGAPVNRHAADGLGDPGGVPAEELVVLRRTQVADQPQLDDELVDQLLGLLLGDDPCLQVPLEVDVQEGGGAAQGGGGPVVLLDPCQIGQVDRLHRLPGSGGGAGQVHPIPCGHLFHLLQGPDLLRDLLPQADALLVHGAVQGVQVPSFFLHQPVDAVQGNPAVVPDDPPPAVGVRQAGEQAGVAGLPGALRVSVKDPLVVGLAVLGEVVLDLRVQAIAVLLQGGPGHPGSAVQVDDALEGRVGLKAHDDLVLPVDIAGGKAVDSGDDVGLHIQHALPQLLAQQVLTPLPHRPGALCGAGKKAAVPLVGGPVLLNKGAHIDAALPLAAMKALPCLIFHLHTALPFSAVVV